MDVRFRRTGTRRYAVSVTLPGEPPRTLDPAPAYDDDIPHDLVHYVVEAELRLENGVYGRAARGAGSFIATAGQDESPRERARKQRKQRKLERALSARYTRQLCGHGALGAPGRALRRCPSPQATAAHGTISLRAPPLK